MANFLKLVNGRPEGEAIALTDLPSIATGTALANISGSSATPTAVSLVSTATASTIMLRDTNANVQTNNLIDGYTTVATASGTTTLTVASAYQQFFTGTTTQTVVLPVASTLVLGQQFLITNASSGIVTVESSGANTVIAQSGSSSYLYTCVLTSGTTAASWYAVPYSGGGAVTPTVTVLTSGSGTFTTPSNALYIQVEMVGGGGGGAATGTSPGIPTSGTASTFGTSLLSAGGGSLGNVGDGGAGGASSLGSGPNGIALTGGAGGTPATLANGAGGSGGSSALGGAGTGGDNGPQAGSAGASNTGGGGGGGGGSATLSPRAGGGSGGYIKATINNPSATYSYSVGSGGTGGTLGTGGAAGGAGGSGVIIVTTFYNNGAVGTATNVTGVVAKANGGTGSATYPGDYYASVYYPASTSNNWSNTGGSQSDFTVVGTIPSPSTYQNSNFGTLSKATSNLPGINFSAPRTGTIKVTAHVSFGADANAGAFALFLLETTGVLTLGTTSGYNAINQEAVSTLTGYLPVTASSTYNIKLQGLVSAGTAYIGAASTSGGYSMLTFTMEYIN